MRPQDVHHDRAAELGKIVNAYDGVLIARQDVIQSSLVLYEVLHTRSVLQCPLHMADRAAEPEPLMRAFLQLLLEKSNHAMLIKMTMLEVKVVPIVQLELAAPACLGEVDAGGFQSPEVLLPQFGIDDMECAIAAPKAVFDEGEKCSVFLVTVVKEGADMADVSELGTGNANRCADRSHGALPPMGIAPRNCRCGHHALNSRPCR